MDAKDFIISPFGVEDPKVHAISVNDQLFNIAIEMKTIVLLGASFNSVNSEYRRFNANVKSIKDAFQNNKLFALIKKTISADMKKDTIIYDNITLKNVSYQGIDYMIAYYMILKYLNFNEDQFVMMNSFAVIMPAISIINSILDEKKIKLAIDDMKQFFNYIFKFDHIDCTIGSKILSLTRYQVKNSSDLSQSIWKAMYINRIVRNIPHHLRRKFFSPALDWGLLRCSTKHIFSNTNLVSKVTLGESLHYIRSSAEQQYKLASKLFGNSHELRDIKQLTSQLKEVTNDIDYALDDLLVIMFYPNMGNTFFKEITTLYEESKNANKLANTCLAAPIISNFDMFKQVIFQYLYAVYLLARQGIIHNDPHLNNILLTKNDDNEKYKYQMGTDDIISFGYCPIALTIIDYDKSILSHYHHNEFADTAHAINEEMAIVFDFVKKSVVSDYQQLFNCYVMYDIVRFGMIMSRLLRDVEENLGELLPKDALKNHFDFLNKMIKQATSILMKIYEPTAKFPFKMTGTHNSVEWIIVQLYNSNIKISTTRGSDKVQSIKISPQLSNDKPEFISSRRRYADALKQNYISQYTSAEK